MLHFFFNKLKICGNPTSITAFDAFFPTALTHCLSLCRILVILPIFPTFSLLWYLLQWSVISDLDVTVTKEGWQTEGWSDS